jgi:hypothetical protein
MVDRYLLPIAKTRNSMSYLRLRDKSTACFLLLAQIGLVAFQINRYNSLRLVNLNFILEWFKTSRLLC